MWGWEEEVVSQVTSKFLLIHDVFFLFLLLYVPWGWRVGQQAVVGFQPRTRAPRGTLQSTYLSIYETAAASCTCKEQKKRENIEVYYMRV